MRQEAYNIRWTPYDLESGYEIVWKQSSSHEKYKEGIIVGDYYIGSVFGPIERVMVHKDCILIEERDIKTFSRRLIRWDGPFSWHETTQKKEARQVRKSMMADNGYRQFHNNRNNPYLQILLLFLRFILRIVMFLFRELYSFFKGQLRNI